MTPVSPVTSAIPVTAIPVTTIGGYLGAGKTTLINSLLRDPGGRRIAVLVNDFGGINIDASLIATSNATTIALTNGCACCVLSDDLGEAFISVVTSVPPFDEVFVEASGVADPRRLAEWATLPGLRGKAVVVLADVVTIEERLNDVYLGRTARRQLQGADVILLTKTDLVSVDAVLRTANVLRNLNSSVPIETNRLDQPWELFDGPAVSVSPIDPVHNESGHDHLSDHSSNHSSVHVASTFRFTRPVTAADLHACFSGPIRGLVRAKGFVRLEGEVDPCLLQVVGSTVNLAPTGVQSSPESTIVVIGIAGLFDIEAFAAIVAPLGVGMMGECT